MFYGLAGNVSIGRVRRHLHKEDCSMQLKMVCSCNVVFVFYRSRVQLKCDGTRWRTGGEVKGKLANGVGSQYPSHYLGTWCIQHYYRWCAHLGLPVVDWTDAPRRFKRTRPYRRKKTKSGFCACAITFQTQSTPLQKPHHLGKDLRHFINLGPYILHSRKAQISPPPQNLRAYPNF